MIRNQSIEKREEDMNNMMNLDKQQRIFGYVLNALPEFANNSYDDFLEADIEKLQKLYNIDDSKIYEDSFVYVVDMDLPVEYRAELCKNYLPNLIRFSDSMIEEPQWSVTSVDVLKLVVNRMDSIPGITLCVTDSCYIEELQYYNVNDYAAKHKVNVEDIVIKKQHIEPDEDDIKEFINNG